jgi:N-acetylglutamate synthase-like GNAT family acetyltransferase
MKILICNDKNWLFSDEAFSIYSACIYQPTYEKYKEQMERFISNPSVKIFVCESKSIKEGMFILEQSGAVPEIIAIAVSNKRRHHGIGRKMIFQVMKSQQLDRIQAQTDDDAIGFYRKCGFTEERVLKEFPDGVSVRYLCELRKDRQA